MNQLTTLAPEQARENFYKLLDAANIDTDTLAEIGQAATDWMNTVRIETRQDVLTEYRNNISIPHDKTYPTA